MVAGLRGGRGPFASLGWARPSYEESFLIMDGQTDFCTLTLLPSQAVSCVQMLRADSKWRWIGYETDAFLSRYCLVSAMA